MHLVILVQFCRSCCKFIKIKLTLASLYPWIQHLPLLSWVLSQCMWTQSLSTRWWHLAACAISLQLAVSCMELCGSSWDCYEPIGVWMVWNLMLLGSWVNRHNILITIKNFERSNCNNFYMILLVQYFKVLLCQLL